MTSNAVLASPEHRVKVSLRSPLMLARIALVDSTLTYSSPPDVTAQSGLDALTQVIEPLIMTALPKVLSQEMSLLEPIIRQSVFETASPLIKERIDQFVREEINAVRTALSDMVREELGSLEGLVKEEIHQAAAKQTAGLAEALVRVMAREQVEQAVLRLVPDLTEKQIKAEITRLTQAA